MANIRTARRSGLVLRGGRNVRETAWLGATTARTVLAAPSIKALVRGLSVAEKALRPFTVVRTRGILMLESDQTSVSEFYGASYGLIVVSDQAVTVGVTAVPTPDADSNSDLWLVFERMYGALKVTSDIGRFLETVTRVIDSRAMRKVEDGQDLISVAENDALSTSGLTLTNFERVLVKLH